MSGKQFPFLLGTLLCFMSAPPVASLPIVRKAASEKPALNVHSTDESIQVNGGGIAANVPDVNPAVESTEINADAATKNTAAPIGINADGATKNTNEWLANQDAATNAIGRLDEQGGGGLVRRSSATSQSLEAVKGLEQDMDKKRKASALTQATCKNSASRRRSDLTCEQLAGLTGLSKYNLCGGGTGQSSQVQAKLKETGKTIALGEAAEHCCETCGKAPVIIIYGSPSHSSTTWGEMNRPEELRTFQCKGSSNPIQSVGECQPCTSTTDCWHGGRRLDINVAGGSEFAFFRAEVNAVCPPGADAQWSLRLADAIKNGELKWYVNDVLGHTLETKVEWKQDMMEGPERLRIDFTPTNRAQDSYAELGLIAKEVSASFERCQDKKNCLRVFGDGSEAGVAMRNSNENQWLCLSGGGFSSISGGQSLVSKCTEWKDCMLKEKDELLETAVKMADNAAVAIEPEIALGSTKVAFLANMAKKKERKANQEHYILGEDNANKCPEGSTKIQTEAECKVAASELGKGQWGWKGAKSKADKPSKCWKGNSGNANWNPHAVGSAAPGRRPICKQAAAEAKAEAEKIAAEAQAAAEASAQAAKVAADAKAAKKKQAAAEATDPMFQQVACTQPCEYTTRCLSKKIQGDPLQKEAVFRHCTGQRDLSQLVQGATLQSFCLNPTPTCMTDFKANCPYLEECFLFEKCSTPGPCLNEALLSCKFVCEGWKSQFRRSILLNGAAVGQCTPETRSSLLETQDAKPNRMNFTVDGSAMIKRSAGAALLAQNLDDATNGKCEK